MMTLERAARVAWIEWGYAYAMYAICSGCSEMRYCRGRRRSYLLCLNCFDQRQ